MAGEGDGVAVTGGLGGFEGEVGVEAAWLAVGVVFVAFGYGAGVVLGGAGFEQGSGWDLFFVKSCSIVPRRCLGPVARARCTRGEVVGGGGVGRVGYHKEGLVEIVAIGVIALGRIGVVGFGVSSSVYCVNRCHPSFVSVRTRQPS